MSAATLVEESRTELLKRLRCVPIAGAHVSECGRYRYSLWRIWSTIDGLSLVHWIGLNPSTADALHDDPTIRRMCGYARAWGLGGIIVTNLYAYRATKPSELYRVLHADDEVSPHGGLPNMPWCHAAVPSQLVVACWGAVRGEAAIEARRFAAQWSRINPDGRKLHALATTKDGWPAHPLYQPSDREPVHWEAPL